jgi:hypothetical protein
MFDIHAELAFAGVLGKVTDVTVGGEDSIVVAQITFDRARLGRRFHDHEVLWHGRECSTGSCTLSSPRVAGPAPSPLIGHPPTEV